MDTSIAADEMPPEPVVERCTCCERSDVGLHIRLYCHPDVALCDRCLLWLNARRVKTLGGQITARIKSRRDG